MKPKQNLPVISFIVLTVWLAIVLGGEILQAGKGSLDEMASKQFVIALFVAPIFLLAVIALFKWDWQAIGFKTAQDWKLLWLPGLFVLGFIGMAVVTGLPPTATIVIVLVNSMLVGISEELMFRGILFRNLMQTSMGTWAAIWVVSIVFGLVHSLNGFMTGDFIAASAQALAAMMSGIWLHAIRLRTTSLYPAMIIHGLWDFALFLVAAAVVAGGVAGGSSNEIADPNMLEQILLPALMPLPLFVYGLWLLRGIGRKTKAQVLA
ncbi:CPBP family intramembrane metalloprotease [Parahaliea maris]|uniref:CPBP family intramembrane metalloprotease n=1 Tax=Parahaliea maris TaxID=2716870 RepID=A0A5C8ZTJ1_9GAMM|nr:type II CAAX endopeptidase family protein [Parahaliea maris]TXS90777.1 CPBP family intramembrane metalloprotease [Parahaliea maris]